MERLDAALSPSRVVTFVEPWPYLQKTGLSVDGCEVRRVRPSGDGVVELEYRLSLHRPGTAHPEEFKATLLGRIYPDDRGESDYHELLASRRGKEHLFSDANLQGFALYVPELRLLLHSSLEDEKLPGLQTALSPEAMQPLLEACLRPGLRGPGEGETGGRDDGTSRRGDFDFVPPSPRPPVSPSPFPRLCEVAVWHYKPGKRCTLRYRLAGGSAGGTGRLRSPRLPLSPSPPLPQSSAWPRSLIGKIYGDAEDGERVFATMQELDRRGFGRETTDGVRIPQPFGYINDLQMVVMEELPGVPLSETLSMPGLDESLAMAARAAAKIHRCPLTIDSQDDQTPADWIRSLARDVSKEVDPDLTASLEAGLRLIEGLARELPPHEATLVHGGFYPREVVVGGHGVAIVDMDKFHNADPAIDVGNFIADLRWRGLQLGWSEEKARSSSQTFLSAYVQAFRHSGGLHPLRGYPVGPLRQRIDFYYRVFLLRRACRVAQRPQWRALTGSLIAEVFKEAVSRQLTRKRVPAVSKVKGSERP